MKPLLTMLLLWPWLVSAAELPETSGYTKLVGMMSWDGTNSVWLLGMEGGRFQKIARLHRGEDLFGVRVIAINPASSDATMETKTQKRFTAALPKPLLANTPEKNSSGVAILAEKLPTQAVVELLGALSGRTVLQPTSLPGGFLALDVQLTSAGQAVGKLKAALFTRGIQVVEEGDKFLLVAAVNVPLDRLPKPTLAARVARPEERGAESGAVRVQALGLDEFLDRVCQPMVSASIARDATVTGARITLDVRNALTRAELVQAFERVLQLNGIAIQTGADQTLRAAPLELATKN